MLATPQIETATTADIPALVQLRLDQGWHRQDALLEALQSSPGGRTLIVREGAVRPDNPASDRLIATTGALAAPPVGVIGNVIVRAGFRGMGLGRGVMTAALEWLFACGVRSVLLDATDEGRPLYEKLGFVAREYSWFGHAASSTLDRDTLHERADGMRAALRAPTDILGLAALDHAAFGGDRLSFLERMLAMPQTWLYIVEDERGAHAGYALARCLEAPPEGVRVGPVVATTDEAAAALLSAILADDAPWRALAGDTATTTQVFCSLPGTTPHALKLFESAGGQLALDDMIMQLDFNDDGSVATPAAPLRPVGTHPEWLYGWVAPMVF